jgi:hypothetical protein
MFLVFNDRPSDLPVIERVWQSHSETGGVFHSMAAPHCGLVVSRLQGRTSITIRGPETRATLADCPAEGEWFGIHFPLGTFLPQLPGERLRDRNDVTLPSASSRSFWLDGSAWEYPTFENVETFVKRLMARGLIVTDGCVRATIEGATQWQSTRTLQRHFLRATGLSPSAIHQIERARQAVSLLKQGLPILDVVHQAGFYDQAHLTKAMNRFVGQTPAELQRGDAQLSLLYKTGAV